MQFQFVGCGDTFCSGGRFDACFHVTGAEVNVPIDCGAASLFVLKRPGIRLNDRLARRAELDHVCAEDGPVTQI